jgi:hypothetical protein
MVRINNLYNISFVKTNRSLQKVILTIDAWALGSPEGLERIQ